MRVVIAGGHGQIAQQLERLLSVAGHEPVGLVRDPQHAADLAVVGATAEVVDLESSSPQELADVLGGADAVVFAAGAGPGSNAARKDSVDRAGAVLLADAAELAGVRRYLMVSAMGTEQADPGSEDVFQVYLRAKAAADADLMARDLDWVVLRPGRLTDDPGTGLVRLAPGLEPGSVPRADVAAVLAELLGQPTVTRTRVDLVAGPDPVSSAVAALAG